MPPPYHPLKTLGDFLEPSPELLPTSHTKLSLNLSARHIEGFSAGHTTSTVDHDTRVDHIDSMNSLIIPTNYAELEQRVISTMATSKQRSNRSSGKLSIYLPKKKDTEQPAGLDRKSEGDLKKDPISRSHQLTASSSMNTVAADYSPTGRILDTPAGQFYTALESRAKRDTFAGKLPDWAIRVQNSNLTDRMKEEVRNLQSRLTDLELLNDTNRKLVEGIRKVGTVIPRAAVMDVLGHYLRSWCAKNHATGLTTTEIQELGDILVSVLQDLLAAQARARDLAQESDPPQPEYGSELAVDEDVLF